MSFSKREQDELIEQYNECDDLICVNGTEMTEHLEYSMDKDECIRMISNSFSQDDSIIHLTDNNYGTHYLELYNKNNGKWFKDPLTDEYVYDIDESDMYFIICPKNADKKHKKWFADIITFVLKKAKNGYKSEDVAIICHDESCQTWDSLDLYLMRQGESYTDCTIDHCDYERYKDTDIANLTEKIINNWDSVKSKIEDIINRGAYGYAYKMNGFCMIIEKQYIKE